MSRRKHPFFQTSSPGRTATICQSMPPESRACAIRSPFERPPVAANGRDLVIDCGPVRRRQGHAYARFVEWLEESLDMTDQKRFRAPVINMLVRPGRKEWHDRDALSLLCKENLVSRVQSLLDHEVCGHGGVSSGGRYAFSMQVMVPATSLYPCSKEIPVYGAHTQAAWPVHRLWSMQCDSRQVRPASTAPTFADIRSEEPCGH